MRALSYRCLQVGMGSSPGNTPGGGGGGGAGRDIGGGRWSYGRRGVRGGTGMGSGGGGGGDWLVEKKRSF